MTPMMNPKCVKCSRRRFFVGAVVGRYGNRLYLRCPKHGVYSTIIGGGEFVFEAWFGKDGKKR